jgi:mxaA protein
MISLARLAQRAFVLLLAAFTLATAADDTITVSADEPRAFGYMVGDVVEREITIESPRTLELDPDSVPKPGRRGGSLELQRADWHRDREGDTDVYRLRLRYQVFLSPPAVRTIEMPPVTLHFAGMPRPQDVRIDAWPVTVSPLAPVDVSPRNGLGEMRPDLPAPPIDTRDLHARLAVAAALGALLAGYLVVVHVGVPWWSRGHRPFSEAWRQLKALPAPSTPQQRREAFRAVHRALDRTAGEVVFEHGIDRFIAARPRYRPLRDELAQFFVRSRAEFFADPAGTGEGIDWLLAFARRCRDIERGVA